MSRGDAVLSRLDDVHASLRVSGQLIQNGLQLGIYAICESPQSGLLF